jgi:hypothetical protein
MKPITFSNTINPLLENFESLSAPQPEQYVGFVYIWSIIPEEMFYIGSHHGKITDAYDGTGSRFSQALRYHGITQFKRVILEYVQDKSKLKYREQFWIDKFNAVRSKSFYNMKNAVR